MQVSIFLEQGVIVEIKSENFGFSFGFSFAPKGVPYVRGKVAEVIMWPHHKQILRTIHR